MPPTSIYTSMAEVPDHAHQFTLERPLRVYSAPLAGDQPCQRSPSSCQTSPADAPTSRPVQSPSPGFVEGQHPRPSLRAPVHDLAAACRDSPPPTSGRAAGERGAPLVGVGTASRAGLRLDDPLGCGERGEGRHPGGARRPAFCRGRAGPPQDVVNIGAEDAPVGRRLVQDHQAQRPEKRSSSPREPGRPGPAYQS